MKKQVLTVLTLGLLLAAVGARADDQPDAKVLLDKAIKAMNGDAKLAKLGAGSAKGRISGSEGGQEFTVDIDGTWQGAKQYRAEVEFQGGGQSFKGIIVVSGDKAWFKKDDKTEDAPDAIPIFIQNVFYAGRLPQLLSALRAKEYKLTPLGEVKVGAKDAVGLSISHDDRKDASLFFDKSTGLPLKSEIRLTDPRGKEISVEYQYSDYKDFGGVKLPAKTAIKLDDKELTLDLTEIKGLDKVDNSQFERP
jgi:hypothetical protein